MSDRKTLDQLNSDDLDQLYDDRDRADESARRALEQRQEMAAERYIWQERGDRAEARIARVQQLLDTGQIGCCAHLVRTALDQPAPEPAATQATDTVTIPAGHCAHCGKPVTGNRVREWNGAASNGPGRIWHPDCHEVEVDADEPDTITDPKWLKQQYAEAIKRAPFEELSSDIASNGPLKITAYVDDLAYAVSLVRDRHLHQLRQRLALADEHQHSATSQTSRPCPACARADQAGLAPAELHAACRETR